MTFHTRHLCVQIHGELDLIKVDGVIQIYDGTKYL